MKVTFETDWSTIKSRLRSSSITSQNYQNFIEPLTLSQAGSDSELSLVAPSRQVGESVQRQYIGMILQTVRQLGLPYTDAKVEIDENERLPPQKAFDFRPDPPKLSPKFTFSRYVVGACNEFAYAAAMAVAARPGLTHNPLYIYSDVGLGKTHLMQALARKVYENDSSKEILYVSAEEFVNEMVDSIKIKAMRQFRKRFRSTDVLLVDDIQFLANKPSTQIEFFHTFNELYNDGRQIVICGDREPGELPQLERRLTSRFSSGLTADIQMPSVETKMAIIDRIVDEAGIDLPADVRTCIASSQHPSIREMQGFLDNQIARAKVLFGGRMSLSQVRSSLAMKVGRAKFAKPSVERIQAAVAQYFDLPLSELLGSSRKGSIAHPRHVAMYLARTLAMESLSAIARAFHRHHTTALHGIQRIERLLATDADVRQDVETLRQQLDAGRSRPRV